ncbi:TadE/TadG family type IV pilus assembly protein [Vibrio rarus]|uniref:TadE/TadG family type IV pilus assembly protein n=1 Tax=Vibrio rarus TaxID=413403 RepID=UPI0021C420A6|nr:TadE/TadG family type IV pilus assembly protein [Vibrio rarus]
MKLTRRIKQKGVVSIEFALGGFALFLALFAVFEMGRFAYIVNLTDATLSESTRKIRIYDGQTLNTAYKDRLDQVFASDDSFWNRLGFLDYQDFSFEIDTYTSLLTLEDQSPAQGCERCPLVMYQLTYHYSPVVFETVLPSATISRRILTIQEHEGWEEDEES